MIGNICGDIIGSAYESKKKKDASEFILFDPKGRYTDDTVLTIATADAILNNAPYGHKYFEYALKYPNCGYGGKFKEQIAKGKLEPYDSYGNGSAMRVSPVAWAFNEKDRILEEAKKSAECSHNHAEGIKGAQAIAYIIWLCRNVNKYPKNEIASSVTKIFGYDLSKKTTEFDIPFDVSCQGTIPRCWAIFNETENFVEAIKRAVDMGGDVDTNCCIVGGICDAYYGLPNFAITKMAYDKIPPPMAEIVTRFVKAYVDPQFRPPNVNITASDAISLLEI